MVEIWRLVTDLDKKKQALAIALSLMVRVRDSTLEMPTGDLNKDDGMTTLLTTIEPPYPYAVALMHRDTEVRRSVKFSFYRK